MIAIGRSHEVWPFLSRAVRKAFSNPALITEKWLGQSHRDHPDIPSEWQFFMHLRRWLSSVCTPTPTLSPARGWSLWAASQGTLANWLLPGFLWWEMTGDQRVREERGWAFPLCSLPSLLPPLQPPRSHFFLADLPLTRLQWWDSCLSFQP